MATHSSVLAWRIPGTVEPGGLHTVHGVTKNGKRRLANKAHLGWREIGHPQAISQSVDKEYTFNAGD